MKLGIFGGTFNPPHNTHVNIARQAVLQLKLDKLLVFPCGDPPHKRSGVNKYVRLHMARLAFDGVGEVCDYETKKASKSYTVDTLRHVAEIYSESELYLIIGGDSFRDFGDWHLPQEIAQLATIAVVARGNAIPQSDVDEFCRNFHAKVVQIVTEPNAVSSSDVRLRLAFGDNSAADCLPPSVFEYVESTELYSKYVPLVQKLKTMLTPKRFDHTFHVVKRGLELARGKDEKRVFLACLLHDCAKYIRPEDYAKYGFVCPSDMPPAVVHAFLGAIVAEQEFGITDKKVLSAIRYHCTAKPKMSRLAKIVYVADKTEETRPYPLEHLLSGTLDQNFVACLDEANQYCLTTHGDRMYHLTEKALKYYVK